MSVTPYAEQAGSGAIVAAVQWLESLLFGTAAMVVAVTAVAAFGVLVMSGRIEWRRGATILIGCFILFGAQAIAAGILSGSQLGRDNGSEHVSRAGTPPHYDAPSGPRAVCWSCGIAPANPAER